MQGIAKDIFGQRFGRLVAVRRVGSKNKRAMWLCACECGGEKVVDGVRLRNGAVRSCGCIKREGIRLSHGHNRRGNRTKAYSSWHHMRDRCLNPSSTKWDEYGGRGIKICDRWGKFEVFLKDMGECPPNHTIDRIDVNGNYEPGNCRWADAKTQSRNVRRNVYLTVCGETLPIWDWAKRTGITVKVLHARRRRGWSDEQTVRTPLGERRKR